MGIKFIMSVLNNLVCGVHDGFNVGVLIDDIWFDKFQNHNTVASFPIVVDGSKAFSASITGFKDVRMVK
jgi:hypothetical protein